MPRRCALWYFYLSHYPTQERDFLFDIAKRLFSLSRQLAEKYSIFEALCLYWKDEFAHLLETRPPTRSHDESVFHPV
jgi:hypothetical protein